MSEIGISQYSLLNSNDGQVKIIEFDNSQGIAYIWGLNRCYKTENINASKDEIQDPDYIKNGDFENTYGYFSCMKEFIDINIHQSFPNAKIIPLGIFTNIYACRSYLDFIRTALNKEIM